MSQTSEGTLRGVDVAGPEDAETIVFVHGAVFQRKQWVPQRDALAGEFRVVTLDMLGHGVRSDTDYRLEQTVDLLADVFETAVDCPAILVGHSLGGYTVTAYAHRHPETVDGLVVAGSSANPVGKLGTATRAIAGLSRLLTRSKRIRNKLRGLTETWVRKRDLSSEAKTEIIGSGFYPRQFGVAGPELAGRDFRAAFADYPGPALVLNGEADAIMRNGEDKHVAAADNARVEVIEGTGHVCNLEDAASFTDAIRRFSTRALPDRTLDVEN